MGDDCGLLSQLGGVISKAANGIGGVIGTAFASKNTSMLIKFRVLYLSCY